MTSSYFHLIVVGNMVAHEPRTSFKWPIAVEREIAAPAGQLWNVISMPGNLALCHPFCAQNPVHAWPGADSRDAIHYLNGLIFERRFTQWIEGIGYDLEIGRRGGGKSSVSWRISPVNDLKCVLRITVFPCVLQKIPVVIRWLPFVLRLRPKLRTYLDSVIRGFEWYVVRGEPVPRDHFGKHPWFSAPD